MSVRRAKPYVCVDCDFADHPRFLSARDLDVSAGVWLRCLAYSRAQELDGVVKAAWVKRTFAKKKLRRIDELVAVGLLRVREDGDYELRAYAPRNQTKAMIDEARSERRERAARWRALRQDRPEPASAVGDADGDPMRFRPDADRVSIGVPIGSASSLFSPTLETNGQDAQSENPKGEEHFAEPALSREPREGQPVTHDKRVTNAFVPTSTSSSTSTSLVFNRDKDPERESSPEATVTRGGAARRPLPPSERNVSGPAWLAAFTEGISAATGEPCTAGRMYLATLERIVEHHAPKRDAPRACAWIREQSRVFAKQWYKHFPAKGLTPDGLERWLNEGRNGPPEFGKPKIVQLPRGKWKMGDVSDLGAVVLPALGDVEAPGDGNGTTNGKGDRHGT
jgi:hypothetical protein